MNTSDLSEDITALAATVAPEDLRCGDYVAVLNEIIELPSFLWSDLLTSDRGEPVRIEYRVCDGGTPLEIHAICLPFVLVEVPRGRPQTLDIRQSQLVRLSHQYARLAWKALKKKSK